MLDDWIDGTGYTPDQVLAALRQGMGGMSWRPLAVADKQHERHADAAPSPSMNMSSPAATPSSSMSGCGPRGGLDPVMSGAPVARCWAATPAMSATPST